MVSPDARHPGWTIVPFPDLEGQGVTLPVRFAVGLPLARLVPSPEAVWETIAREGLGEWHVVALRSEDLGHVVLGAAAHDGSEQGASVWAEEGVTRSAMERLLADVSGRADLTVVES